MYCTDAADFATLRMLPLRPGCDMPLRRMEDKIRALCAQLLAEQEDAKLTLLIDDLRNELHQLVERLRAKFTNYPVIIERRKRVSIPQ